MSGRTAPPDWLVTGEVGTSIRNAISADVGTEEIVTALGEHQLDDVLPWRIESIIEATPAIGTGTSSVNPDLSQTPSTSATPRDSAPSRIDIRDFGHLTRREGARVVGLVLELFEGKTVRPNQNENVECDLYWNRQHTTTGLRIVPSRGDEVGGSHVEALIEGETELTSTRAPSKLVIVSNGRISERAIDHAKENGIHCLDGGHLESWCRRAAVPPRVYGRVLEEGENHDGPLIDLVEISPIPDPRQEEEPLTISRVIDPSQLEIDRRGPGVEEAEAEQDEPSEESTSGDDSDPLEKRDPTSPDEIGKLHSDPEEDGDYDVFDKYLGHVSAREETRDKHRPQGPSGEDSGGSEESRENTSPTVDEPKDDPDRLDLLLELLDAKNASNGFMTEQDIGDYCPRPAKIYIEEFGSLERAMEQVGAYDEDSGAL